jgi:hypothetical protein
VTPQLDVRVGRVNFENFDFSDTLRLSGHVRGASLSWSMFGDSESLFSINLGPTTFPDFLHFKKFTASLSQVSLFDFFEATAHLTFQSLELSNNLSFAEVELRGKFKEQLNELSEISFEAFEVKFQRRLGMIAEASEVSGSLDFFQLDQALREQDNLLNLNITSTTISDDLLFIGTTSGFINNNNGLLTLGVDLSNMKALSEQIVSSKVKILSDFDLGEMRTLEPSSIQLTKVYHKASGFTSPKSLVKIFSDGKDTVVELEGNFEKLEVIANEAFVGTFPRSNFLLKIDGKLSSEVLTLLGSGSIDGISHDIEGNTKFKAKVKNFENLYRCIDVFCKIEDLNLNYEIVVADETLSGYSACNGIKCDSYSDFHSLRTRNTNEFLINLSKSGLVSPLISAFMATAFLSGDPIGQGHEIKF